MALINCPECGKEISNTTKKCPHCGYTLKKFRLNTVKESINKYIHTLSKTKKIFLSGFSILCVLILSLIIVLNSFTTKKERIAISACKAIVNCLNDEDSFDIIDIYFNDDLQENTIVKTKYQVFVEFTYRNSYGGTKKDRLLYILTPSGQEHLIESGGENSAMYNIAESEIYAIHYLKWEKYNTLQIKKILRKIK